MWFREMINRLEGACQQQLGCLGRALAHSVQSKVIHSSALAAQAFPKVPTNEKLVVEQVYFARG